MLSPRSVSVLNSSLDPRGYDASKIQFAENRSRERVEELVDFSPVSQV